MNRQIRLLTYMHSYLGPYCMQHRGYQRTIADDQADCIVLTGKSYIYIEFIGNFDFINFTIDKEPKCSNGQQTV